MTLGAALTLAVLAVVTMLMAAEWVGADVAMFSGLAALVVAGVVQPDEAVRGFANPALVTIGVLFVVASAVQETGGLLLLSRLIFGETRSRTRAMLRLVVPTAVMSSVLNNTPIVAMFIPAVRDFALRIGDAPSRYLMPLAFAAILGGTCTAIGTSSNLVVSAALVAHGLPELGMFELSAVGVPTATVGVIYLTTLAKRLLPDRRDPADADLEEARQYLAEVEVMPDSPLVDRTIEAAGLRGLPGLFLVEIRRAGGSVVRPVAPHHRLQAGDHLVFTGLADTVKDLQGRPGVFAVDGEVASDRRVFEVVLAPRSPLLGQRVRESGFRRRYDAAILAVHRSGVRMESKIGDIVLQAGDTLMLVASPGFLRAWRNSPHFVLATGVDGAEPPRYHFARFSLGVVGALVLAPAVTGLPLVVVAMAAMLVLLAAGAIDTRAVRQAINWPVLVLIGSALGIATALDKSGAASALAGALVQLSSPLGPHGLLAAVYILAAGFAAMVSNPASAALVFPVAVSAAEAAGLDARPFAIAVAMGASAAFFTPTGVVPNLLVYGPGGYRYGDFARVGAPLTLLGLAVTVVIVPIAWPLAG